MYFYIEIIGEKFEVNKSPKYAPFGIKCSKLRRLLGLRPRPRWGSLRRSPIPPIVVRGFLPSAIAASRLRRSQFPPLTHSSRSPQLLDRGCAPAYLTFPTLHSVILPLSYL